MHPHRIGPYLIDKKIGAGGMGTVYRGTHADTGQIVAVKVLPASLARETGFVARFNREIKAIKTVQSPHIVSFYDSGETADATYFYAMEYVKGETLTNLLRREKRLPWHQVIDFSIQIAMALKAAHNAGVFHRDLKPSNLMIANNNTIKLTDFGVAHVFASTRLTRTGGVVGTAEYMAPEQAKGEKANKRSDLYSLGAVMYVMLTGRPPFTGKTSMEVAHKLQFANFDMPSHYAPGIPARLEQAVCKLLEKKPDDRFQDALQVIRELEVIKSREDSRKAHDATMDGDSLTIGNTPPTVAVGQLPEPAGPGSATFVRNYVREQFDRREQGTHVSRLLNNTWVMLGLLGFIIAGGFYFVRPANELTPQARFERGQQLIEQPDPQWSVARREYFEPLLANAEWAGRVKPVLQQIEQMEANQALQKQTDRITFSRSEPERLLRKAKHLAEVGETEKARLVLQSVIHLLAGNKEFAPLLATAEQMINRLDEAAADAEDRQSFLAARMKYAAELQTDGKLKEARRIWQSIVDIYPRADAREIIDECNKLLQVTIASTDAEASIQEHE
jgi:serine/threonine protein kinase